MSSHSTSRASLLAGLRTGGVRSVSSPLAHVPHSAAPAASFNLPRIPSQHRALSQDDDDDDLADMPAQNHLFSNGAPVRPVPMTAAVDGSAFSHQQKGLNPNSVPFSPAFGSNVHAQTVQVQALQMQMMQLEIMRLQTIQAQQYQAELLAQVQRQQQQQQQQAQNRRANLGFNPPATAGPTSGSFDLRSATIRRANQAELLKAQLGITGDEQVPMTATLGGKFGSRTTSGNLSNAFKLPTDDREESAATAVPPTPSSTTVISGGTSLGSPASNNISAAGATASANTTPSKSDSALSWRRGGNNNSVLSGNNRSTTSPRVRVTPPLDERITPPPTERNSPSPPAITATKSRPVPLRFSTAVSQMLPAVAIDDSYPMDSGEMINSSQADDGYSTSSSKSISSPTTPRSSSSSENMPLSPREEASKKLYEGLGIGRPAPVAIAVAESQVPSVTMVSHRLASLPMRQPRGPPSGTDELAPQNFATRLRRKAIGGLGAALMSARERREVVEAY